MKILEETRKLKEKIFLIQENILDTSMDIKNLKILNYKSLLKLMNDNMDYKLRYYSNYLDKNPNYNDMDKKDNLIIKFSDYFAKNRLMTLRSFGEYLIERIAKDFPYKFDRSFPPDNARLKLFIDFSTLKVICKAKVSSIFNDKIRLYGGASYFNTEKKENQFTFFSTDLQLQLNNLEDIKEITDTEIPDVKEVFFLYIEHVYTNSFHLVFPIDSRKKFNLDDLSSKFSEIDNTNLPFPSHLNADDVSKLKKVGEQLTKFQFEDTIKSQKVGRVISKL